MNRWSWLDASDGNGLPELLWEGEERRYCRIWRRGADGARRECIAVVPDAEHPSPHSAGRLAHEYALRDYLDGSCALRPLELVRERGQTVLVLEHHDGEPLDRLIGPPMQTACFLRLAVALSAAVGGVHARGLVHKDIKPANALVDAAGDRIWLTGFGVASRLPRERQSPDPPELIAGTLSHMAPEQTGRMNRSIDSRSDLYALGVTLYQMLTGSLPFTASDPMEWVHCHVARRPVPPDDRCKNVPSQVSAIVMKLLAKTPEERYQTAAGVERDLRRCAAGWEARAAIDAFALGEHDNPDRLLIPEKLYGRAHEITALLDAFDDVAASGATRLVLVCGPPGIGKSAVVNELHKVLVPRSGLFASGKFDQLKRDVPYATLAQAFESLVRHLLGRPEAELARWREELSQALDPNGALVVELIPALKFVIGEQPPAADAPDTKARFLQALRQLIGVFARREHPLALFLDDLQWLDAATLDLLEDLLVRPDPQHMLLLVGAYRDNEVHAAHPLARRLEAIRETEGPVQEIALAPLSREELAQLIADALRCERKHAMRLAELVHHKTAGNPFFANQFIHALVADGSIAFDPGRGTWSWDIEHIQGKSYTDNVVELMVGRLGRLPPVTRKALEELACLGNGADASLLAQVHQASEEKLHSDLWEALCLELVVRSEGAYRFVHDRVQEAAYSLLAEERRAREHLRIGRLLDAQARTDNRDDAVFDVVGQLNRCATLITSQDERDHLAELNLAAGKRAMATGASASALTYLAAGTAVMAEDAWKRRHDLRYELEFKQAECEVILGEVAVAEERLVALSSRAASMVQRADTASSLAAVYVALGQIDRGIVACLGCLRDAGLDIPLHPSDAQAQIARDRMRARLVGRTIDELAALPVMTDPAARAIMEVLGGLALGAMHFDKNLLALVACAAIDLSLEHGHSEISCFVYAFVAPAFPDWPSDEFDTGYTFARLGLALVERPGLQKLRLNVYQVLGMRIMPWAKHIASLRDLLRGGMDLANKSGNRSMAAASSCAIVSNLLVAGDPLAEVEKEAEFCLAVSRRSGWQQAIDISRAQAAFVRSLRGTTLRFGSFDDDRFDEGRMQEVFAHQHMPFLEFGYWVRRLTARLFAGDIAAALDASVRAQPLLSALPAVIEVAEHAYYGALAHAAAWDAASAEARLQHLEAVVAGHRQLDAWARHCPENFANRAALVAAEIARIEGRDPDAMRLYEQAIRSARDNNFVHNEALAAELAGRFYTARGFDRIAEAYLRDARTSFLQWGADGKVRHLDALYPHLRGEDPRSDPTRTVQTTVEHLDLATVLKVSQAVSGETDLEKLIAMVMRLSLEHAGAERGLLILPHGDAYLIEAEARIADDEMTVALRRSDITDGDLAQSAFHYVVRTKETVLVPDASAEKPFADDAYVRRQRVRAVLCMPLLKQNRLVGVIYLENNLASGVFTPARVALLKLLASDAAISLENARLYRDLQEREARVRRLVDANIIGIVIWGADGRVIDTNEAFVRIVGHGREDLVSGNVRWTDLTPPEWYERDAHSRQEARRVGAVQPHERELIRKDGIHVPVLVGGAVFDEAPDEGVAFVLDLTELKRAEQAARDSDRRYHEVELRLSDANRVASIGQFAASIAHEINQPLSGITINAGTCLRMLDADPANIDGARETAKRTLRDGNRASAVITRLRDLFSKKEVTREPMDLNEATREVIALSANDLQRNRVLLLAELADDLPAVTADRIQLQQVILNLVRNASDAMGGIDDRPRQMVIRTEREEGDRVRLTVRDVGVGLDPESIDKLFDAFYTTKSAGMGIGLSVSRSIIERHHGLLRAEPNDGPGATFWFSIPRLPAPIALR